MNNTEKTPKRIKQEQHIADLITKADQFRLANDFRQCREYASLARDLAEQIQSKRHIVEIENLLGLYNFTIDDYNQAISHYEQAILVSKEIGDSALGANAMNNLGQIFFTMDHLERALQQHSEAVRIDPGNYRSLNNLAGVLATLERYDEAEKLFLEAYEIAVEKNSTNSQVICLGNLGELSTDRGDNASGIRYLDRASQQFDQMEDSVLKGNICFQFASILIGSNDLEQARKYIDRGMEIAKIFGNSMLSLVQYEVLQKISVKKEDFELAYKYAQKENELRKRISTEEIKEKIAHLSLVHSAEQQSLKNHQLMEKSARLASIGVMAAGITHEINQPLNAISVSANSVLYWHRNNPDQLPLFFVEEMEQISKSVDRIDKIIKHMRSVWAHPNNAKKDLIRVSKAIEGALSLVNRQINAHGIFLETDIDLGDVTVLASKIDLEQMILNLVVNAIHSLDESDVNEKKITIKARHDDKKIIVSVSDNGMGFPAQDADRIFDPFFSTKAPEKGMGLGLAIVKKTLDQLQGSILASNVNEGGASFEIQIPISERIKQNEHSSG
ncbi:MAG: tetratricopeptide repeat protein [Candidatus Marinimicrobia bacterium]|nr:tetratricopeptide repeat protein [Candidatus Neomarinimicrobiota bacterium]